MARRMDRKVIKLEAAYGSERQFIVVKRNQDLIVRDLMEDIQKIFKIPVEEQVIFHKGTNLCDFLNETLENLGIENNNPIRVTRDTDLPNRSPRMKQPYGYGQQPNQHNGLDPVSYLKEISPQRVPDPTPYQVQVYNQNIGNQNPSDVIKLYVSYGSEREYVLVHGKKPLMIYDLKLELSRAFKIPTDQQCIVFKGFNLHEYLDDAPLEAFGLENNSPISLWPKSNNNQPDLRLPRGPSPPPQIMPDVFSPRIPGPPGTFSQRWVGGNEQPSEVLKVEIQHGSDRHQLILKGQNKTLTVLDLQNELERLTAVPVRDQRLFFKAQELHLTPGKTLKECDLENNHVVKLVGEPSRVRYSNYFGKLNIANNNDPSAQALQQQFNPQNQQPYQSQQQQQYYNPQQQQFNGQQNYGQPNYNYPPQKY